MSWLDSFKTKKRERIVTDQSRYSELLVKSKMTATELSELDAMIPRAFITGKPGGKSIGNPAIQPAAPVDRVQPAPASPTVRPSATVAPSLVQSGPLTPDAADAKAKAEWSGMAADDRKRWSGEKSYVSVRSMDLTGRLRVSGNQGIQSLDLLHPEPIRLPASTVAAGLKPNPPAQASAEIDYYKPNPAGLLDKESAAAQAKGEWASMPYARRRGFGSENAFCLTRAAVLTGRMRF